MTKYHYDENGREVRRGKVADTPLFDVAPLPNVPAPSRANNPATSYAAAESVTGQHELYRAILAVLDEATDPLIDDEIIARLWARGTTASINGIKTRRGELVRGGFVREVDQLGKTKYGRAAIRWGRTGLTFTGEAEQVKNMRDAWKGNA